MFAKLLASLVLAFALVGCVDTPEPQPQPTPTTGIPQDLLLETEPAGARGVAELLTSSAVGDEVVVAGWIGGSGSPLVAERAVMTVVDASVYNKCRAEECCETPWDYCCALEEAQAQMVSVRVVDAAGKIVPQGFEGFGGIDASRQVTVRGKISTLAEGVLVVDATGVWVAP